MIVPEDPNTDGSRAMASMIAAALSAVIISTALFAIDPPRRAWEQPLLTQGPALVSALVFVFPFTLFGSVVVLWPHKLLSVFMNQTVALIPLLIVAGLAGGVMLFVFRVAWDIFAIGALSGAFTAIMWSIAFHLRARRMARELKSQEFQSG